MLLGINAPVQGWTDRGRDTSATLGNEIVRWLASEGPQDAAPLPDCVHLLRLDNWTTGENADAYVNRIANRVSAFLGAVGTALIAQLGNEPDLEAGHGIDDFPTYAEAFRRQFPGVDVASPPLSVEHTTWITGAVCDAADYVSVHSYWETFAPADVANPGLGASYRFVQSITDKPIIISEVNANASREMPSVDWNERNQQVADWCAQADDDGVYGACLFIADAAPDWAAFDVGPDAAADILAKWGDESTPAPAPPNGGTTMVSPSALVEMGQTQLGQPYSGTYDSLNGNHQWAYWCLAYTESTHRNMGLTVQAMPNAVTSGRSHNLSPGRAPLGAVVYFDESFYFPDGHVGISMGDGTLLGTVTDGTGVGYRTWNENTTGYMGWCFFDGVDSDESVVPPAPDPPPPSWFVQPDNPYQVAGEPEIGIGGGFLRYYNSVAAGLDPMVVLGFAKNREETATVTDDDGTSRDRTVQQFERGTLIYQPDFAFPYDVTMALATQRIEPK